MLQIVQTKAGKIAGTVEEYAAVFKGIPYAEPPVGEWRFRRPETVRAWEGIFQADKFPKRALQLKGDPNETFYTKEFYQDPVYQTEVSEDCLYLNIWVPLKRQVAPFPVAFFIHGGAFNHGTGHEVEFRTQEYARRGIILVTINYRLGLAGFLAHPLLQQEDALACGNYGILDQMKALEWVRENIGAFGGDPENITIFGQSAGAVSVQVLLSAARAKGVFAKAIIQSAGGYPARIGNGCTLERAFLIGKRVMELAGADTLEELRQKTEAELLKIQENIMEEENRNGRKHILCFEPCVNQVLLTDSLDEICRQGRTAPVPVMIGVTRNDLTVTEEEACSGESAMKKSCVAWSLLREEKNGAPAYVYQFSRKLPGDERGAFHSSELWYMFGTYPGCWSPLTEADGVLSEKMLSCWCAFMKTGIPDGTGMPRWLPCTLEHPFVMEFDVDK